MFKGMLRGAAIALGFWVYLTIVYLSIIGFKEYISDDPGDFLFALGGLTVLAGGVMGAVLWRD